MVSSSSSVTPGLSSRRSGRQSAVRPESASDAAVVDALWRGDEDAFTRLVDQHQAAMLRIARLFVSSPAVADGVVQDTWLAVIHGLWAFEGRSSLKTRILRILINRAKTRAERERRTGPFAELGVDDSEAPEAASGAGRSGTSDDPGDRTPGEHLPAAGHPAETSPRGSWLCDPEPSPEAKLLTKKARLQIRAAIDALPPSQRIVITLRDLEGCTDEAVCNVLGLSETNQRVTLHRARSRVRAMLAAYLRGGGDVATRSS